MQQKLIFLVGMMGSGKSYWAQRLADALDYGWGDLDQFIEKETSLSVKEIFETQGEDYFRNKERDALRALGAFDVLVIATGGGTPCFHNNMDWMNANGITIWIDEPVRVLAGRLLPERESRPLIKNLQEDELEHFLAQKLGERKVYYAQAAHHVHAAKITINDLLQTLNIHV